MTRLVRRVLLVSGVAMLAAAVSASGAWASTLFSRLPGEMLERRYTPAVAVLPNGNVLVAGGYNETLRYMKTAELFIPATGSFTKAPEMTVARDEAAFGVLPGGKVLIAGGYDEAGGKGHPLKSAELFNPETNTFEALPAEMTFERDGPAGALLANGKFLIAGGADKEGHDLKSAELFNPASQTFEKVAAEMTTERFLPAATTLPNGKVLIVGGQANGGKYLKSAELFNPATNTFESLTGPAREMSEERFIVAAVTRPDGKALIVGGSNTSSKTLKTTELFNFETNTFEPSSELTEPREGPGVVKFPDGSLLIVGGYNQTAHFLNTTEASPAVSATGVASSVGVTGATLNGTVFPEGPSMAYFQYGTSTAYGLSTARRSAGSSLTPLSLSAAVTGLAPTTTYHFRLVDEQSGSTYGADQTFTTAPAPVILPIVIASTPPITNATQSHRTWRESNKLAHITRKRKPPVGTTFSLTLNEPASVSFAFTQKLGGRKVKGRCVAQTKANRRNHACERTVTRGTLAFTGHAGTNKVAFQGRISRSKKLRLGTYTLIITATNTAGQRSTPKQLTFTIVK
jgi:Galactose oxidase, central domain/Kelch motif